MKAWRALLVLAGFAVGAVLVVRLMFLAHDLSHRREEGVIVVGAKPFSESAILAEIFAQLIERHTDLVVQRRLNLGSTQICMSALRAGAIDLYPEYTGTGLMAILRDPRQGDARAVFEHVRREFARRFELVWLEPLAFDNAYALAIPRQLAQTRGIETISEVAAHTDLVVGVPPEFLNRDDGYDALVDAYDLGFASPHAMEAGLIYSAVAAGGVDVIVVYATDARIDKFDLVVLEDDRGFFPPYQAAPLVRREILERHPELEAVLERSSGRIDAAWMRRLNAAVDLERRSPAEVAAEAVLQIEREMEQ